MSAKKPAAKPAASPTPAPKTKDKGAAEDKRHNEALGPSAP